jgi:hypothetical protein
MGKSRRTKTVPPSTPTTKASQAPLAVRFRAFIMGVLPVLAIFLGTRQLLAEAFRIPSGSMEPTLLVGDWLFVNKLRFGPHIPFTNYLLPGYADPKRDDVTVFVSPPQDESIRISPRQVPPMLVKRIVGVGGDTRFSHGSIGSRPTAPASVRRRQRRASTSGGPSSYRRGCSSCWATTATTRSTAGTTVRCRESTFAGLRCSFTTRTIPSEVSTSFVP